MHTFLFTVPTEEPSAFTAVPESDQVRFSWSADSPVILSCHTTPENLVIFSTILSQGTSTSVQGELTGADFTPFTDYACDISIVVGAGAYGPSSTATFQTLQDGKLYNHTIILWHTCTYVVPYISSTAALCILVQPPNVGFLICLL